jgi:hypothetical protein
MCKLKQLALALLLVTITLAGCKKDSAPEPSTQKPLSKEDIKLSAMVKSFKAQLQSPLKSGEVMEVDSAVWYMKLNANFDYGNAGADMEDVSIKESSIPMEISNGYLSMEYTSSLYDAVLDSVRSHYYSIETSEKALSYVNIAIDTIHSASVPDEYQLKITTVVTSDFVQIPWSFSTSDNWWWADKLGKCDGTYAGKDAMTQLKYMFQLRLACPSGGYWIPGLEYHDIPDSYPASQNPTNRNGYYLFLNDKALTGIFHECIPYDEMNFYLNGLEIIGNTLLPQKFGFYGSGEFCIGVRFLDERWYYPNTNNLRKIDHSCWFSYGTPHYGNPGGEI